MPVRPCTPKPNGHSGNYVCEYSGYPMSEGRVCWRCKNNPDKIGG